MKTYINCYINFHYLLTPKQPKVFAALLFTEDTFLLPAFNCIELWNIRQEDRSEIQAKRDLSRGKYTDMGAFPFAILCCCFCYMIMVSLPTSTYSIDIVQVLGEHCFFNTSWTTAWIPPSSENCSKWNTDTQGGLGPAPQWMAHLTPTETIFFSPRVTAGVAVQVM